MPGHGARGTRTVDLNAKPIRADLRTIDHLLDDLQDLEADERRDHLDTARNRRTNQPGDPTGNQATADVPQYASYLKRISRLLADLQRAVEVRKNGRDASDLQRWRCRECGCFQSGTVDTCASCGRRREVAS